MVQSRHWLETAAIALLLASAAWFLGARGSTMAAQTQPVVLGRPMPEVELVTVNGTPVTLRERAAGRATLIFVLSLGQCASCSNLPLELAIVRRELPSVVPLVIGSGASPRRFRAALDSMSLSSSALIDEHRQILAALGVAKEPLTLLIDSTGRIVFADSRSVSAAAQFPVGAVLQRLAMVLRPVQAHGR